MAHTAQATTAGCAFVGTAGWAIPAHYRGQFPVDGSGLGRYGAVLGAAEINSTFTRRHRPATIERWAREVPDAFRFSVKAPKAITHDRRLVGAQDLLTQFIDDIAPLGDKLGPVLVQIPPSLEFEAPAVAPFFGALRGAFSGTVVLEARHRTWFSAEADNVLCDNDVGRVTADPPPVPEAKCPPPGSTVYLRLHGSPRTYFSPYDDSQINRIADFVRAAPRPARCLFDNTASGAALGNALSLVGQLAFPTSAK